MCSLFLLYSWSDFLATTNLKRMRNIYDARRWCAHVPFANDHHVHASVTTSGTTEKLLLGIDIGTSTVKAVLLHKSSLKLVDKAESSKSLGSHLTVPEENVYAERGVHEIFTCLDECLASLESNFQPYILPLHSYWLPLWKGGNRVRW